MMKNKKLIIAAVFGLVTGILHITYVRGLESETRGGQDVVVLATAAGVRAGEKIEEKALATRRVPTSYVDRRVVRAEDVKEVIGLVFATNVEAGQMIQWSDFTKRIDPYAEDLSEMVESGQRAITIPVDGSLSMGGMLRPGHRVDILGSFSKGDKWAGGRPVTVTLLQNVFVLATGRDFKGDKKEGGTGSFNTVTLSVGLEEAELLCLATTQGKLSLILRGRQDLTVVRDIPEKSMDDVWEAERRNALQEKPRRQRLDPGIERLKAR
ncbi:MAG: Flp pilus assembly protein CpaB [Proteobacteria bacterium]|nr:Flp pilus assembly protein CpaB [Pseudomonadota bacterium]